MGSSPLPRYAVRAGRFPGDRATIPASLRETARYGRAMCYHRILRGSLLEGAYVAHRSAPKSAIPSSSPIRRHVDVRIVFVAADTPGGPAYSPRRRTTKALGISSRRPLIACLDLAAVNTGQSAAYFLVSASAPACPRPCLGVYRFHLIALLHNLELIRISTFRSITLPTRPLREMVLLTDRPRLRRQTP
jgi:hypothetical protein